MDQYAIKNIVEALIMSSAEPISISSMMDAFEEWQRPTLEEIETILSELMQDYASRGIELKLFASGYAFQTQSRYSAWVSRLLNDKPVKYSSAMLETLAIIAYRQPVTRADIEDIRGVASSSNLLKTLLERGWIRVAGHRDVPGKPAVYTTTKTFLDYFNLGSLNDLPLLQQSTITHDQ